MKSFVKFLVTILSVMILFSSYVNQISVTAVEGEYVTVDCDDLCSSDFLDVSVMQKVTSGVARAGSDIYGTNYGYELLNGDVVYFTCIMSSIMT